MEEFFASLSPPLIWFLVGLLLLIAEMFIPGLIIFFFGVGAWIVALLLLFFNFSLNLQLIFFLGFSVIMLFLLREKFNALFQGFIKEKQPRNINVDDLVGGTAVAITDFEAGKTGEVEYHGTVWKAISGENISAGEEVKVTEVENLTLKIEKK